MPNITGSSDVSRLNLTGPGANARSDFGINTDPFGMMPEIAKRSFNQANLRYSLQNPKQPQGPVEPQKVASNRAYDNPISRAVPQREKTFGMADQLAAMRAGMESEDMMLARLPAPMRLIHGPGIVAGMGMDVNAMNAAQRQRFLPQSSSLVQDGDPVKSAISGSPPPAAQNGGGNSGAGRYASGPGAAVNTNTYEGQMWDARRQQSDYEAAVRAAEEQRRREMDPYGRNPTRRY